MSMEQDADSPIGFLLLFSAIAIFSAFKRSKADGAKTLGFCVALAALVAFVPKIGMLIVGALGLVIAFGLIKSFM